MTDKPHIVHTITAGGRGSATSHASTVNGNWLAAQAYADLPRVHQQFDKSRDPLVKKQLADRETSETERRGEQDSGGGHNKRANDNPTVQHGRRRRTDKPAPVSKPKEQVSDTASWLKDQHAKAMANIPAPIQNVADQNAPEQTVPKQQPYQTPSL